MNTRMKTDPITQLPAHVADAWYLATASAEGHVYETKIIRGADLLKTYAEYMYSDGLEDMDDDDIRTNAEMFADPNTWHVIGKHWADWSSEFEDGEITFTLITPDAIAKLPAPTPDAGEDGELLRKLVRVADIADLYMGPPCNNPMPVPDDRVVLEFQHGDDEVTITLGECRRFRAAQSKESK